MIGQRELLKKIDGQIDRGKFPKVSILVGELGSGRRTLAHHISQKMDMMMALINPTMEEVVEVHNTVYNDLPVVCVFHSCDYMPPKAMDIIRTMVDDLPDDVYFILTCEDFDKIIPKIKEKSVTYIMDSYSYEDKCDFLYENYSEDMEREDEEFLLETTSNLGEVQQMCNLNIKEFKEYTKMALNIVTEDSDNSHEIGSKIAFDSEEDKFPIRLFWRAFITVCGERMQTQGNSLGCCRLIAITGDYLQSVCSVKDAGPDGSNCCI